MSFEEAKLCQLVGGSADMGKGEAGMWGVGREGGRIIWSETCWRNEGYSL